MKEHIIRAILYQDMSVKWKDTELKGDVNVHLNVHQKTRQFVEVELDDFLLSDGEAILASFEKTIDGEIFHENPAKMDNIEGDPRVFRLKIPTLVHNTPGEWGVQFFVVTDYNSITGDYENSYPFDKVKFVENSSFIDDGLTVPSKENLLALYNSIPGKVNESFQKETEAFNEKVKIAEDSADSAATSAGEAADSAGKAADSAGEAKTAEENAETAKGDAETAKNAAEAAREAAEIFSATAQTHANNASTDATAAADSATTAQEAAKEAKIYAIRAEEVLEGVGNFIPGELGEDGKFYPFDKDTGQVSTTALAAPSAGVVYFDLFSNKLYTWDSASNAYIIQADLNATGGGGSLDPSVLAEYVKKTQFANYAEAGIVYTPSGDESYTGVFAKNGIPMLMGSQRAGALSDAFFNNPHYYSVPVLSKDLYRWIKVGLTQNDETLTDEEKTAACETVGALKTETAVSGQPWVYIKNRDGTQNTMNLVGEWDDASSGVPMYFADRDENGNLVYMQLSVNPIPTRRDSATSKEFVENNFVAKDTVSSNGVYGKSGGVDILYNVSQWGYGGGEDAIARRTNKGGLRVVLDETNNKAEEMATPRSYVDSLQKFTHYITIRSTDETASPANVNLQITNYDDFSLTVSESIYDFSQLASAIGTMLEASEENPGSVSASGSIIYNGSLHLVLSATTKDGTALILKTFDTSAQELAEITMEEPYFLIDEIIKKEI